MHLIPIVSTLSHSSSPQGNAESTPALRSLPAGLPADLKERLNPGRLSGTPPKPFDGFTALSEGEGLSCFHPPPG